MDNIRREKRIEHREREIEIKIVIEIGSGKAGSLSGNFLKECFGERRDRVKKKF